VPAPVPLPQIDRPSWEEIHERNMARLRELAAAWAKAGEQERDDRDRRRGHR
jgi:hypothetical protein